MFDNSGSSRHRKCIAGRWSSIVSSDLLEIDRQQDVAAGQIEPLGATGAGVFELASAGIWTVRQGTRLRFRVVDA